MRNPSAIMLVIAVLVGAATVWMVRGFLESRSEAASAVAGGSDVEMATVVVASHPLSFGDTLHKDLLREVNWPKDVAPEGTFSSIEELLSGDERRVALRNMEPNELVLKSRVSGFGGKASLSQVITPGLRATAIRVNDVVGVAGFVLPGDRVDILLTRQIGKDRSSLVTDVLIQNVRVLAVDQLANERAEDPVVTKTTTVEVTPRQVQKLSLAARVGSLTLALRNMVNGDGDPLRMQTVRVSDLVPGVSKPKKTARRAVRRAPTSSKIKIVRGLDARTQTVKKEKPALPARILSPVALRKTSAAAAPLKSSGNLTGTSGEKNEPVAALADGAERTLYAAKGMPTVTTASLARSFQSAEDRLATEDPFLIMRVDTGGN